MKKLFYSLFMMALTAMTFTSCEDVPMPYDDPNKGGGGSTEPDIEIIGDGSAENPYNASSAVALFKSLASGAKSEMVYIKGKVSSIKEQYGTQYGNGTFYISDDGSSQNQFYVFRALYLGNKKYTSGDLLKEGDEVIICGVVTNYNGTIETEQNNAFLYSLNGVSEGGGGSTETIGTANAPITTAKAIELINALADGGKASEKAYVKGKIVKVATTEENFAKYGNLNYYISDDGSSTNQIQVYAGDGLNGEKFKSISDIKAGDEVVVFGVLYKYVNKSNTVIPEITDSYLVKLTEGSGGGGGTDEIKTVSIADFNAAPESSMWYKLSGTVKNLKDGDQYGNFDLEDNTGSVYVYGLLSEKGGEKKQFQTLAAAKGIKNGVKITIIGNRGSYNGKIEVMNAYFVSVDGEGGGGEEKPQSAGSYESPLTVTEAIAKAEAEVAWVKGYIVGYVTGAVLSSGARFTATAPEGESVSNTNLLIAASASETDVNKCMPIQLTRNKGREEFELNENSELLKKEVILAGQLTQYFQVPGLKELIYLEEVNGTRKVDNR